MDGSAVALGGRLCGCCGGGGCCLCADGDDGSGDCGWADHGEVSGSVNPNGTSTSWYVEYGTASSYGSKTSSTSAGSGTSPVGVSANLTGLHAGTTYHYRFVGHKQRWHRPGGGWSAHDFRGAAGGQWQRELSDREPRRH